MRKFVGIGSMLAFLGVALGAFGSHGLKGQIPDDRLEVYTTGVHYHLIHAIGLILIGLAAERLADKKRVKAAGWLILIGTLLFSGSLYVLAVSGIKILGIITPFGGVAFLAGWCCLAWAAWKEPNRADNQ
ncbi:DUF423 domain-containing protein [Gorillibacterium timonense]|uniref:DUF423 domain-containing protein n=1 Tax=Gorillibacterium timonense TaxID=1689269 RepID=UPI00071CD16C|nr:DUF423 domain-containing protein [Gorillibacterium timonense]